MIFLKKALICMVMLILCTSIAFGNTNEMKPGYGIEGVIYLGNTRDQVIQAWGEPDMVLPLELYFGPSAEGWKGYFYVDYDISLAFNQYDKIIHIATKSNKYFTPEGIKVGHSFDDVVKVYGNDYFKERCVDEEWDYKLRYEKEGFEFHFTGNSLGQIGVF